MSIIHITKTIVEKLESPLSGRIEYFDDALKGFGIRVSPSSKSYFTLRRVNGKLTRTKIDTSDKITAEKARKQAEGILADMGRGIDPNEIKRQARQQAEKDKHQVITLQAALDQYVQKGKLKPRSIKTYQDLFRLYLADWLNKPAREITRDMIKNRHQMIATQKRQRQKLNKEIDTEDGKERPTVVISPDLKPKEAAADNCMRTLRAVLNYFFEDEEGVTPYMNPVNILSSRRKKAWFGAVRRQTIIKNSNLPSWYKAVMGLENSIMRDFLRFLLFTGLRRKELETLKWKQVDLQEGCFTIVDTKNNNPHTLPLSDYLQTLLVDRKEGLEVELTEAKKALAGIGKLPLKQQQAAFSRVALAESRLASQYVFPGEGKTGYIVDPKRWINTITAETGIPFSCHDLRRTFATIAESLDLSTYTVKAFLNHKKQLADVTGGYIIISVDRLRDPMQKITDAILERVKKQYGQVVTLSEMICK